MKIMKTYCDCCNKEINNGYYIDICAPDELGTDVTHDSFGIKHDYGKITVDGIWELELCKDCLLRATRLIQELKTPNGDVGNQYQRLGAYCRLFEHEVKE